MTDNKQLWESVLSEMELGVSKANFSTWFKNTKIVRQDGGVILLGVPNEFVKDWLYQKYHKAILETLRRLSHDVRSVEYIIHREHSATDSQRSAPVEARRIAQELPLHDLYVDKEDNLNPRYTFDSFVIGSFNELAYAASQGVIKNPGLVYNPLFVYGETGLGKTHLIQAVGNFLKKNGEGKRIHYITSEKFSVDFINSLQSGKINFFKEKYRKYDVLVMDDIQFLSGKEKTQEELFHLFNALYDNNKQIVFSSDKHPNFIPNLEDRLKSRFSAGMIVDVGQPEYEARREILRAKARQIGFTPPDEIIEAVSSLVEGNIRELEGILNLVVCQSQLKNRHLTVNEIRMLVKNNTKPKKAGSVRDVVKMVADFYNIDESSVYEKTRRKEVVKPRQVAMYLLREDFSVSYPSIGEKLGGRDHTTVIHSCEKIKNDIKKDHILLQEIEQIRSMF